jgi:hypothetical protein
VGRREDPSYSTWQVVNLWVEDLASAPWQAPSTPFPELSDLPNYEVRIAEVPNSDGVEVFYRREFTGETWRPHLGWTTSRTLTGSNRAMSSPAKW